MDQRRIHEYLDGDRPWESLSLAERERASALESAISEVGDALIEVDAPDLTVRVMAALSPGETAPTECAGPDRKPTVQRLLAWMWAPRPVRLELRPLYGLAAAAVATVLFAMIPIRDAAPGGGDAGDSAMFVQFRVDAPGARKVALAGTFTEWEPRFNLRETSPGIWTALVPLEPGVHDYVFVIDGTDWVADPHAFLVDDSFGGTNSRITLLPPGGDT